MFEALLAKVVAGKAGMWLAGLGGLAAIAAARRIVPGLVAKYLGRYVAKVLAPDAKDPELARRLQAVAIACVNLAEYMVPDRGQGKAKRDLVAAWLSKSAPWLPADKLADLIQEAWEASDDVLRGSVKK